MLHYDFMQNAFAAAGMVAVGSGVVGYFIVLRGQASPHWIDAVREHVPVFRDQRFADALRDSERLGADLPCARVVDSRSRSAAGTRAAISSSRRR